ncbi:hypothetical protein C8F01DRAFT_1370694 [Mycena amicta]|nr:hypothetical protein C8F01DRAFT_1370694 [Mycena amicta]
MDATFRSSLCFYCSLSLGPGLWVDGPHFQCVPLTRPCFLSLSLSLSESMAQRTAFTGLKKKLVIGIDLGTTFSGISYCLLEPNVIPKILPVTRFPAQSRVAGDCKVPSVILYDMDGKPRALGAETADDDVKRTAQEEGWQKAAWFKLSMRPTSLTSSRPGANIPALPTEKTPVIVFADFLKYLLRCARTFITETYRRGEALWITLEGEMEFVLTHPNGWTGEEEKHMRRAAVLAKLIPGNPEGHKRVHFVTEGEASLNFCILNGLASEPLNAGEGVVIIDAGGGTVDISAYRNVSKGKGNSFTEIAPAECLMDGSIFVTQAAELHFTSKPAPCSSVGPDQPQALLQNSVFRNDVHVIKESFDQTAKLKFRSAAEFSYIRFGGLRDNNTALNIDNGTIRIAGNIVATFFQPTIDSIVNAVNRQRSISTTPINSIFMTGGFSASEYLFSELKRRFAKQGIEVSRPDLNVNKAVSDGAVSFYLDRFVSARIAKETYGIDCSTVYDSKEAEHRKRSVTTYLTQSGDLRIPGQFFPIVRKNTAVKQDTEFRRSFFRFGKTHSDFQDMELEILRYSGTSDPQWMDVDSDKYSVMCTVHADISKLDQALCSKHGSRGNYYELKFDVVLSLGMTELKAYVAWREKGVEKRGPAEVLYEAVG